MPTINNVRDSSFIPLDKDNSQPTALSSWKALK